MIRAAPAVCADRHPDQGLHREFPAAQVTGFGDLRHQLIEAWIDIIRKLDFHDGPGPHGAHPYRRADDIGFLDGRVEYPVIPELLGKRSRLAEDAAQTTAYVLAIEQGFRVGLHDLT